VVFRDRGRLLTARTRPGVFAHRRIDPAARHLLNAVDVAAKTRVLDVGCGSGCVALGIAARDPSVRVHAFDSAARAVGCTRWAAEHNGLTNLTVALEAEGHVPEPGTWDLALANPPYYSDFRLAELFVESARLALIPGGTLLVVTKQPTWYVEQLPQMWTNVARAVASSLMPWPDVGTRSAPTSPQAWRVSVRLLRYCRARVSSPTWAVAQAGSRAR
jgi:16S rRNA (guanine1207-N2)-methyltransferase